MKTLAIATMVVGIATSGAVDGRNYAPLGGSEVVQEAAPSVSRSLSEEARPVLPGIRPVEVELLEDALRRKQPLTIGGSREKAYESIIRNSLRDPVKRSHVKGILAEALYLEKNPEWGYSRSPNAPQVDVYRWLPERRRPLGAQIKTHATADPTIYARDMVSDHKASLFLVPDDHVQPVRDHWRRQVATFRDQGAVAAAADAERQLSRVRGLGFSSKDLDDHLSRAARYCLRERNAGYISMGAGLALATGADLWELGRSGALPDQAGYRAMRAASIIASERATHWTLGKVATGALRGGLRGNAVSGLVMIGVDTGFSIYENGGAAAFRSEAFYTGLGGGIAGTTLAFAVGMPVTAAVTAWTVPIAGPWAPAVGGAAGFVAGLSAGAAGYYGGQSASRTILEAIDPQFLHDAERTAIEAARTNIADSLAKAQRSGVDALSGL